MTLYIQKERADMLDVIANIKAELAKLEAYFMPPAAEPAPDVPADLPAAEPDAQPPE